MSRFSEIKAKLAQAEHRFPPNISPISKAKVHLLYAQAAIAQDSPSDKISQAQIDAAKHHLAKAKEALDDSGLL